MCGDEKPPPFLLSHVLKPWGKCIEYLVPDTLGPIFKQLMSVSSCLFTKSDKMNFSVLLRLNLVNQLDN